MAGSSDISVTQRAAIFVDGSNFFKYCEELHIYAYQLEWDNLLEDLVQARRIEYANYYDCPKRIDPVNPQDPVVLEQERRQKQFFSILRKIRWLNLKFGRLEPRRVTWSKRRWT